MYYYIGQLWILYVNFVGMKLLEREGVVNKTDCVQSSRVQVMLHSILSLFI